MMKNYLQPKLAYGLIALGVALTTCLYIYYFKSFPVNPIPQTVLDDAHYIWQKYMLDGSGIYRTQDGKLRPPLSTEEPKYFSENIDAAQFEKFGIIIQSELNHGYTSIAGGLVDALIGPQFQYELYGRKVGQYIMPYRAAWNSKYFFSHADYFLLKRNLETKEAAIILEFRNKPSTFGSLLYNDKLKKILVILCGDQNYEIQVYSKVFPTQQIRPLTNCTNTKNRYDYIKWIGNK